MKDKIIIITGAARGLGKEMAKILKNLGAKLVLNDCLDEILAVAQDLGTDAFKCDVTKKDEVKNLAEFALQKFGRIDVWINNAGKWIPYSPIENLDSDKVHEIMEINFFGTLYGSQEALRQMLKQGSGMIVNIISVSALEGRPLSSGYCATKFAQDGFTKALKKEAEPKNITVLSAYPGKMNTNLYDEGRLADFGTYLDPAKVAEKIVINMQSDKPVAEMVIREV